MATKTLTHKHRAFAREFAECFDIEVAANRVGLRAREAAETLATNGEMELMVREAIARQRLAADFADPEALRMRLYQMAINSENESVRVRAAALFFDTADHKAGDKTNLRERFDEVAALLTNAKKPDIMARNGTDTDTDTARADAVARAAAANGSGNAAGATDGSAGGGGEVSDATE